MNTRILILSVSFFITACETPKPNDLTYDFYVIEHSNDSTLLNNSINEIWKSEEFSSDLWILFRMVRFKMDYGKYDDAIEIIQRILESPINTKDRFDFLAMKMETLAFKKEFDKSNIIAKTILAMDSVSYQRQFSTLLNMGNNYASLNDIQSQRFYTKLALDIAESDKDSNNAKFAATNLLLSYLKSDECEQANYYNTTYELGYQKAIDAKLNGDTNYFSIVRSIQTAK